MNKYITRTLISNVTNRYNCYLQALRVKKEAKGETEKSTVTSLTVTFLCISIMTSLILNSKFANCGVTSFFWLKRGTYAVYSFPDAKMGFDDLGFANPVRGNYTWVCLEVNYTHATLDVEVNIELFQRPEWTKPGHIRYKGQEFVDMAANGDLSFIKRIPMNQVVGRIIIHDDPHNPSVSIPSPVVLHQEFIVSVNLDSMMMVDENGEPWGKWVLWIDSLKYPLEGRVEEPLIMNWLNTTVSVNVTYMGFSNPKNTIFGEIRRGFKAFPVDFIYNEFLLGLGVAGMDDIYPVYSYEPRTGILLYADVLNYLDDIFTQKFGIIMTVSGLLDPGVFFLADMGFQGDMNKDWVVNISDIAIVAKAFNTRAGDAKWNLKADINKDETVNIVDITIVAKAFGTQYITTD